MIQRVDAGRELTQGAVGDLSATLSDQVARGVTGIHMMAGHVITFDSGTLQALVEFDELAKSRGLMFTIVNPSELLYTALRITGLAGRLEFLRGDEEEIAGEATPMGVAPIATPTESAGDVPEESTGEVTGEPVVASTSPEREDEETKDEELA